MNLYLISQNENRDYDTYDSAVVCAESEDIARKMSQGGENGEPEKFDRSYLSTWCSTPDAVNVRLIGKAAPDVAVGVVCASFNAG